MHSTAATIKVFPAARVPFLLSGVMGWVLTSLVLSRASLTARHLAVFHGSGIMSVSSYRPAQARGKVLLNPFHAKFLGIWMSSKIHINIRCFSGIVSSRHPIFYDICLTKQNDARTKWNIPAPCCNGAILWRNSSAGSYSTRSGATAYLTGAICCNDEVG